MITDYLIELYKPMFWCLGVGSVLILGKMMLILIIALMNEIHETMNKDEQKKKIERSLQHLPSDELFKKLDEEIEKLEEKYKKIEEDIRIQFKANIKRYKYYLIFIFILFLFSPSTELLMKWLGR